MTSNASGLPLTATPLMAASVSPNESVANFVSASSNDCAIAGCAAAERQQITMKAISRPRISPIWIPRQGKEKAKREAKKKMEAAALSAASSLRRKLLCAALVGLGVVVAAFQLDPVADQILRSVELLGPGVAGHQT